MAKTLDQLLGKETPVEEESTKRAAEDGVLEAFYQEAEKIAGELGVDNETASSLADKVMGTKVATHVMIGEVHRLNALQDIEDHFSPGLAKAAEYAPMETGPYRGILRSLHNRKQ